MSGSSSVPRFVLGLVAPVLLAACSTAAAPGWTFAPATAPGLSAPGPERSTAAPTGASPGAHDAMGSPAPVPADAGPLLGTLVVRAYDIGYDPTTLEIHRAGRYLVRFVNAGAVAHDITFADGTMIDAAAGMTTEREVMFPPGGLSFSCSIPGHAQAGQQGTVEPTA